MEKFAREDLEMFLEEVLDDPDATLHFERLIALIGKPEVEQLVSEAKWALTKTGGYKDGPTMKLLMGRVLFDQDRAERLVKAYDALEFENVTREMEDPVLQAYIRAQRLADQGEANTERPRPRLRLLRGRDELEGG